MFGYGGVELYKNEEEKSQEYPLRISINTSTASVDLFFLINATKQHYCWITSLSCLLTSQLTHHNIIPE